jgi:AraC family transcriptional regulator
MWTLKAEMEDYAPADDLYGESLGIALATRLLRRFSRRLRVAEPNASKRRLLDVLAYIDEHLDTPLAISSLAEYADLSVSHFKSLFRTVAGLPVHQYVLQRRIDVALALIAKRVPLKDVAARAGFYDQSHMTRTIRRRLGTSPHELSMQ